MELAEVILDRVKRAWFQPEKPAQIRVRPASRAGIVLARWKCNLGLALFADGLGHLSILNPARQVGESALSIVAEKMATTPNGTLIGPVERGPRVYPGEAAFLLALTALAGIAVWFTLAACDVVKRGPSYELRQHVTQPLERSVRG